MDQIAVFWDFENCSVPSSFSGYEIVKRIREIAHQFGSIRLFKAYTQLSEQSPRSITLRSELQSSGVSITDCPHNGYKNVADQMIITDMLTFAMDNPTHPSTTTTIMILSGDRDFAYTLSVLRLRKYNVAIIAPSVVHASLREQASQFFEWSSSVLVRAEERSETKPTQSRTRSSSSDTPMTVSGPSRVAASQSHGPPGSLLLRASNITREDSKALYSPSAAHPSLRSPATIHSSVMHTGSLYDTENKETRGNLPEYSPVRGEALLGGSTVDDMPNWLRTKTKVRSNNAEQSRSLFNAPPSPISSPAVRPVTASAQFTSIRESTLPLTPPNTLPLAPLYPSPRPHSAELSFPRPALASVSPSHTTTGGWASSRTSPTHTDAPVPSCSTLPSSQSDGAVTDEPTSTLARIGNADPDRMPVSVSSPSSASELMDMPLPRVTTSPKPDPPQNNPSRPSSQAPCAGPSTSSVAAVSSSGIAPSSSAFLSAAESTSTLISVAPSPPSKVVPQYFLPLVQHLEKLRLKGVLMPHRSVVALVLIKGDNQMYERAGCNKFKDFAAKAEKTGLIQLGGQDGTAWIRLHPDFHGRIETKL